MNSQSVSQSPAFHPSHFAPNPPLSSHLISYPTSPSYPPRRHIHPRRQPLTPQIAPAQRHRRRRGRAPAADGERGRRDRRRAAHQHGQAPDLLAHADGLGDRLRDRGAAGVGDGAGGRQGRCGVGGEGAAGGVG